MGLQEGDRSRGVAAMAFYGDAEEPRRADRTAHSTNSGRQSISLQPKAHIAPFRPEQ
jgi:hypothetical protein